MKLEKKYSTSFDELFDKETANDVELPKTLELEEAKRIIEAYEKSI